MTTERTKLDPAPAGETLLQVRDRLIEHALRQLRPEHESITALADLYRERIAGREQEATAWLAARDKIRVDLARDLALALDLALYLDLARDRASASASALDLDLALARARDLDLDLDLCDLLGDRLTQLASLDADILRAVTVERRFALYMGTWHDKGACGTTHCRAGAAIVLHPLGLELETVFGSQLAGAVIYLAARKGTPLEGQVPNFFADNDAAMADIRKCAGVAE